MIYGHLFIVVLEKTKQKAQPHKKVPFRSITVLVIGLHTLQRTRPDQKATNPRASCARGEKGVANLGEMLTWLSTTRNYTR